MSNNLVSVKTKVDPVVGAPALFAAQYAAIKFTGRTQVSNRKGEVK
jgi:hypothetical protein